MTDMPPYLVCKDENSDSEQVENETSEVVDDWDLPLTFDEPRYIEASKPEDRVEHSWRLKEKYKTHCVALVLCLNVGVDPPDVVKTQPCARLECWIDPHSMSPVKALETIGHALQAQYERWQPRARYKQSLDPTSEDVKKLCCSLRRNAKDERVLFHYNGHGVPKPTSQGEIWVFNRAFTQYIPLSMYDLQTWMGAPSLYVYDCSNAGVILDNFKIFADQHERDYEMQKSKSPSGSLGASVSYAHCLQLAACAAGQTLPVHPELPADLFTACLTTPVKMAIKWFVLRSRTRVTPNNVHDLIDKIPGQVTDRRTMLGELNWIFTAITDTIAWNSLPADLFQQLFRADLLTASLCRNFLLADRIMRCYNCTPVSAPALPSLAAHPLWQAWEHALDLALAQLPAMLGPDRAPYVHSPFFRDQLTAFQVWLDLGDYGARRPPPDQLPMVLQVLLSTLHRVRALQILCRFLALGAWAVRAVLAVGIFPYMLKLLQASAHDLRASMVYIWAKIMAVDPSCQVDLVNAKGHKYFLAILQDTSVDTKHRTLAAYVLAGIVDNYPAGQEAALQGSMISMCLEQLGGGGGPLLARWSCVALGRLWRRYDEARWAGVRDLAHEKLYPLLKHQDYQVRAACTFALGTFMSAGVGRARTEHASALEHHVAAHLLPALRHDAAPRVRTELLAALQWMVLNFEAQFIAIATQERSNVGSGTATTTAAAARVDAGLDALAGGAPETTHANIATLTLPTVGRNSVYMKLWTTLTAACKDPHSQVAAMANDIVSYITNQIEVVGRDFEMVRSVGSGSSSSLPPSPNTHTSSLGRRVRGTPLSGVGVTVTVTVTVGVETPPTPSTRDRAGDSACSTGGELTKKPIVKTDFETWTSAMFASDEWSEIESEENSSGKRKDLESRAHQQRVWRYSRNAALRRQAKALCTGRVPRLETQVFHSRCPLPPAAVLFHPYEQHVAVASKDNFGIWDWGTGARVCAGRGSTGGSTGGSTSGSAGRISSLAWLDAHDRTLLAVATHTGALNIYRAEGGTGTVEPALAAAWRALDTWPPREYRPPAAHPANVHVRGAGRYCPSAPATLLRWSAWRRSLTAAGHAPAIAVWDLATLRRRRDLATRTDHAVTALATATVGDGDARTTLFAGFADGSVRLFDERDATPTREWRPHAAPVLAVCERSDKHLFITGCMDGTVQYCDTRGGSGGPGGSGGSGGSGEGDVLYSAQAPAPLAAVDVHALADIIACGSVNQCISLFDLTGTPLNTIKSHEGFMGMGARIGPVSCLSFHPLRCALGVGTKDSAVSVYVSESRR